jgi:hypothetical protein
LGGTYFWLAIPVGEELLPRRQTPKPGQADIRQTVVLSQFPCWRHLTPEVYRARVADLIHQIEATAAAERAKKGVEPLGAEMILAQDPEARPETLDRSPAPFRPRGDAEDP